MAPTDLEIIQRAADELPDGVWIARAPGGEFVYANRAFREIMGMEARRDVVSGEYAQPYGIHARTGELYPEHRMPFVQALRAKTSVVVDDIVVHRADGDRVFVRAHAKPVLSPDDGSITHIVIAFFDISREVELERLRAEAEKQLAHAQRMQSIGTLAGGIAHDFNNLLAMVRLVAESLRRTEPDPRRRDDLRRIDEVVESAATLTRSLLSFAGRAPSRRERLSVELVTRSILDLVTRAVDRRAKVTGQLAAGCEVVGDASQIEQLLMNLLVNARDALDENGSIEVRVHPTTLTEELRTRAGTLAPGPYVVIEVTDDGSGVEPAIRDRVFEPYFTTKTEGPVRGTGLGLATAFGIVQAHGGSIELLGNTPRGSTARVLLPAAPASAAVATARRADTKRESSTVSTETVSLQPLSVSPPSLGTVLLVEDEPLVRRTAERALVGLGYTVLTASDGVEAVAVFGEKHACIDVVVLDMIMPRMGGRATYRALVEIDPGIPAVLTTGYAQNDESQAILDLGVRTIVPKPYRLDALAAILTPLIEERRATRGQ